MRMTIIVDQPGGNAAEARVAYDSAVLQSVASAEEHFQALMMDCYLALGCRFKQEQNYNETDLQKYLDLPSPAQRLVQLGRSPRHSKNKQTCRSTRQCIPSQTFAEQSTIKLSTQHVYDNGCSSSGAQCC